MIEELLLDATVDPVVAALTLPDYWSRLDSNGIKVVARRWLGSGAQKMRKDEALRSLSSVLDNPAQLKQLAAGFTPLEQAGLTLLARSGGGMPLALYAPALLALGYPVASQSSRYPFGGYGYVTSGQMYGAFNDLQSSGLVGGAYVAHAETTPARVYSDRRALQLISYSDQRLLRVIAGIGPQPLEITPLVNQASGTYRRPAEVSLRLLEVVEALRRISPYAVTARGRPSKPLLRKLGKSLGWELVPRQDDQLPPAGSAEFYYRLLVALSLVTRDGNTAAITPDADTTLQRPYVVQARSWAAAYGKLVGWEECEMPGLWLYGEDLFDPSPINGMRGALVVALSALPDPEGWYSLSSFSQALCLRMQGRFSLVHPPSAYVPWNATEAQRVEAELKRQQLNCQSWVKNEETWISHALAGPLFQLGLVEIAGSAAGLDLPDRFRLTDAGRAAFYYPGYAERVTAAEAKEVHGRARWVVQPNFEVIAYLDQMTPSTLAFLARVAERKPSDGGVGIYRLTRESVYGALESGLTVESLLQQLEKGAQHALPATLQRTLTDWAGRRERLSLHLRANVLEYPDQKSRDEALSHQPALGTPLGEQFVLVSANAPKNALSTAAVVDYLRPPVPCLTFEETGWIVVDATRSDFLVRGELSNWADPQGQDQNRWRVSAASVARAVQGGWTADKILHNMQERTNVPLPPLLVVAIRSWARKRQSHPASALAKDYILQFSEVGAAEAVAGSAIFRPHLRARLGERTFLVTAANVKPLKNLLVEFGLSPAVDLAAVGEKVPPIS